MMGLMLTQNFYLKKQRNKLDRITKVGVEFIISKADGTYINNCCFTKDDFLELSRMECFVGHADNFYMYDSFEHDINTPIMFIPYISYINDDILIPVDNRLALKYLNREILEDYRKRYKKLVKFMEKRMIRDRWKCMNCGCEEFLAIDGIIEGDKSKGIRMCKYCGSMSIANI